MTSAISGISGTTAPQIASGASMQQPLGQRMAQLFSKIDSSATGSINQAQFTQAFQNLNPPQYLQAVGPDAIFSKLDSNNSGSVSRQDFVKGMSNLISQLRSAQSGDGDGDADDGGKGNAAADIDTARQTLDSLISAQGTAGSLFNSKA